MTLLPNFFFHSQQPFSFIANPIDKLLRVGSYAGWGRSNIIGHISWILRALTIFEIILSELTEVSSVCDGFWEECV